MCCLGLWLGESKQLGISVMRKSLINILQKVTGALVGMRGANVHYGWLCGFITPGLVSLWVFGSQLLLT